MSWKICCKFPFDFIGLNDPLVFYCRCRTKFFEVGALYETSELKYCHYRRSLSKNKLLILPCFRWPVYSLFALLIVDPLGPFFFLSRCCHILSVVDGTNYSGGF